MITLSQGLVREIKKIGDQYSGKKILDMGCGVGDYTYFFGKKNEVTGVDLQKIVRKKFKNFRFKKADVTNLPFQKDSFDLIISFDVIEHIENDEKMLKEAYRVLKKGGRLFFGTPNRDRPGNLLLRLIGKPRTYPSCLGTDPNLGKILYIREYTPTELIILLTTLKFKKVKIYPYWFGLNAIKYGLGRVPRMLEKYAHYLFFEAYK